MSTCFECKYCNSDFMCDEDGEEYEVSVCEKYWNEVNEMTDLCKDFKKYTPRKYVEKDTVCDLCDCKSDICNLVDATTIQDTREHVKRGMCGECAKAIMENSF